MADGIGCHRFWGSDSKGQEKTAGDLRFNKKRVGGISTTGRRGARSQVPNAEFVTLDLRKIGLAGFEPTTS
jgi:hypothetical protein